MASLDHQWDSIKNRVSDALHENFPVEGRRHKLILHSISFDDKGAPFDDIHSQEQAKAMGRTWGANVHGEVSLIDKATGQELDRAKVKLLTLPKPTNRFSYIVDGNERQVDYLWKLRSGVYAHRKQNGQYQAEFNLHKPFAREPRLYIPFDPEKKQFKLKYATSNTPLYSVLKVLGVPDEDMKKTWGDAIYKANVPANNERKIGEFYSRLEHRGVRAASDKPQDKSAAIVQAFHQAELLPETTKAILGKPLTHVNGEALLLASKRILDVARGDIPEDDRDSLVFKQLNGVDDFLHERLTKPKAKRVAQQRLGNNLDRQTKVRDILTTEIFNRPVHEFFNKSTLSRNPEQVNPLEMSSNNRATTILAPEEGGIKNERTVMDSMKLINNSHFGFLDPIHTPESSRTGISLNLPLGVVKQGNEAKAVVYDLKEGKVAYINPAEMHTSNVVLPDQVEWKGSKPHPIASQVKMKDANSSEIISKPFKEGRYVVLSGHQLFDEATNLIPFLQNNQGNRTMTAARQATQAVSLHNRERPLVQVKSGGSTTWERIAGTPWSHEARVDGKVTEIQKNKENGYTDAIVVQDHQGKKHVHQIYNHFPLNDAKSFLNATPTVKVGDEVKKSQVIADTNFTRNGALALGTNLRVSYLPYKGYNFEDGIVISQSAANKLSSEHLHRHSVEIDPDKDFLSKSKFMAYASTTAKKLTKEQANKLGDDGVIKIGQTVQPGDVLIAAVGKRDLQGEAARAVGRLDKKLFAFKDKSVSWDSHHPGQVVKVQKTPNGKSVTVYVKTIEPSEIGDKIVGRHGNKGIITRILPDHDMPRMGGPDGQHVEVLMNPSGVPSRINLGQMLETAASKIAVKTGRPYVVNNFGGESIDYTQQVKDDLKKNGLSDQETLFDPITKRKLGDALTGHQYIMKLKHQVEKKLSVRANGPSYTLDQAPKGTGAEHPGQGVGQLEFYAMLAHGARSNLREIATYKSDQHLGERNDPNAHIDFWHRVMTGQPLPTPKPTFAYRKFETLLTGLGVNVKKVGNELVLQPLTDKGVLSMSAGEIKDPGRVLRGKDAKELEKGLFDPKVTGGLPNDVGKGLKWSHITLAEPVPNPIFVGNEQHPGPAVVLTGMKFKDFEDIARGKTYVDGKTGGKAIENILKKINVKDEIKSTKEQLPNLHGTALDKANRKLKYLLALDNLGIKPHEAYISHHIPVIPPVFRPIVPMQDGSLRFDDINYYYKQLGHINGQLKSAGKDLPDEENQDLREQLYDVTKSLAGIPGGKPVYESSRQMKGILDQISGDQPKQGYFQRRLMKRRQELSMRSTIIPEPAMHLDHVGLPKDAAMELYKPFVVREMQQLGYSPIQALKEIKESNPIAWKALQQALDKRPVLLKRDPALHKFSIMAFKPQLVEGKAIKIHPLVTAGFNADFDGDTMSAFVPLTPEAVEESRKMFPSNNLFSSTNGGVMYAPDQEALLGLHLLSKWGNHTNKSFANMAEAMKAKDKGQIHVTDVIKVGGQDTTLGRLLIGQHLPSSIKKDPQFSKLLKDPKFELVKHDKEGAKVGVHDLLERIAHEDPKAFSTTVDNLKNLGNQYSYELGFSFGLKDLHVHKEIRKEILSKADAEANKIKADTKLTPTQKKNKIVEIYDKATTDLVKANSPLFEKEHNNIYTMVSSGARGKMAQFRQMTIAPMLMKDGSGETIPTPVKKSYAEGLDVGDYWTSLHGARMGTLSRVEGTSEPGRLTKEIVNVVIPNLIVSKDCGTKQGIMMGIDDDDIHDRFLASDVKLPGGKVIKAGEVITPDITAVLKKNKIDKVVVRSPLKCEHGQGICSKCYGLNENGHLHEIGTNIGVLSGHALGEPATQLSMDSFHSGGVAASRGGGAANKFERLNNLLEVPKTLKNSAILSRVDGKIQKIDKDQATNGWNVYIGGERHFIPAQRLPQVADGIPLKVGQEIKKGQPLSDGDVNPRELLENTDIHNVQRYLTDELYNAIYKDERVKKRNIETVVRSLTNLTKVTDPGDSDYNHGDIALRTVIEDHNRNLEKGEAPIKHQPILRSAKQVALDQHEDWLARLNFQRLRDTILEGTAKGWKTDLHGANPVPGYAFGAEFGKGTPEKPHNY